MIFSSSRSVPIPFVRFLSYMKERFVLNNQFPLVRREMNGNYHWHWFENDLMWSLDLKKRERNEATVHFLLISEGVIYLRLLFETNDRLF